MAGTEEESEKEHRKIIIFSFLCGPRQLTDTAAHFFPLTDPKSKKMCFSAKKPRPGQIIHFSEAQKV